MKKLLLIFFLIIGYNVIGQPVVNRAGQANTVQDARWASQYNLFAPRYVDTAAANAQRGIDSCGALIFTYDYNGFWYRQCSPKRWVQLFGNSISPSSDTLVWKLSGNTVGSRSATPVLGTLDGNDLNFMTDGSTRLTLPSGGLVRNMAATVKYLSFDTITRQMYYGDGGGSSVSLSSITAAVANNSILNSGNRQTWTWDGISGEGSGGMMNLISTSTGFEGGNTDAVLLVESLGANVNSGVTNIGVRSFSRNTNSLVNYGVYAEAIGGATNVAVLGEASGTGLSVGGRFSAFGSGNNRAIDVPSGIVTIHTGASYLEGAVLNVGGTERAVVFPRMNTTQMNAIGAFAGFLVYNTDSSAYCFYTGSAWRRVGFGSIPTPTWQQTLTAGSTLTGNNTINGGGFQLQFTNNAKFLAGSGSGEYDVNDINAWAKMRYGQSDLTLKTDSAGITVANQLRAYIGASKFWVNPFNLDNDFIVEAVSDTAALVVDAGDSRVGVGTISPQAKFHVNGSFRLVDGTQQNGYVLTSDADGDASWQPAASGGSPAGNFGNIQINRNGAFATPASDSLTFLSTGFTSVAGAFSLTGGGARVYGNDAFGGAVLRYGAGDAHAVTVQVGTITLSTNFNGRATITDGSTLISNRLRTTQGADVASAAGAIALGSDGNVFEITGTSAITLISNTGWGNGSKVTLLFTSTATLTDGTANSGTDIGMELAGNTNFTGSAGATITLVLSEIGSVQRWRECARSVN